MERKEKKPVKMSVPQFGGWEHKPAGVPTDYSMVFSQARAKKKTQKNDLTDVKRLSVGNERDALNANHHRGRGRGYGRGHGHGHEHGHGHGHGHDHDDEDAPVMVRA
ncbi:fe(2+) transport protein 3 [Spatholobus suberectus]|nr:fe(2+) transport protein 3 [Spatholobus suberectus]